MSLPFPSSLWKTMGAAPAALDHSSEISTRAANGP
jgi:hypothetical protein